jgi:hypothetical protein
MAFAVAVPGSAHGACAPPPGGEISPNFSNQRVEVYLHPGPFFVWSACMPEYGRLVGLRPRNHQELKEVRVAGPFLGYILGEDDFQDDFWIRSLDMRTGRYAHAVPYRPFAGSVRRLQMKSNGSIAWVQSSALGAEVLRLADTRGVRVPPNGRDIAATSLRLRGSVLSWRKGRRRFQTRLY